MKKIYIFLLPFLCYSTQSLAQKLKFTLDNSARYDVREEEDEVKHKFQIKQKVRLNLKLAKDFSVKSAIGTGSKFNSEWNTVDKDLEIHLRNLYGEYKSDTVTIQFGSIPTFKGYKAPLNLDKGGWIDQAVRVELKAGDKTFEVAGGRISGTKDPDYFERFGAMNFIELEFTHNISKDMVYELGYENFRGDDLLKAEFRAEILEIATHKLKVAMQGLMNLDTQSLGHSFEVAFEGKEKKKSFISNLHFVNKIITINEDMGRRGELVDEFRTSGTQWTSEVSWNVNKRTSIFGRSILNLTRANKEEFNYRFNVGVKYKVSN